jgi:hypothetical protein
MRFSFVQAKVTDLVVVRRSRLGVVVPARDCFFPAGVPSRFADN